MYWPSAERLGVSGGERTSAFSFFFFWFCDWLSPPASGLAWPSLPHAFRCARPPVSEGCYCSAAVYSAQGTPSIPPPVLRGANGYYEWTIRSVSKYLRILRLSLFGFQVHSIMTGETILYSFITFKFFMRKLDMYIKTSSLPFTY